MNDEYESKSKRRGRWIGTLALAIVHLLAFGMLYLVGVATMVDSTVRATP